MRVSHRSLLAAANLLAALPVAARAQDPPPPAAPLLATAAFPSDRFIDGHSVLQLTLNRSLGSHERLALTIGTTDVTQLLELTGTRVSYRPTATRLPTGEHDAVLYQVGAGGWTEIGRFPIKVRSRAGIDQRRFVPSVDLSATGQLDQGGSAPLPPNGRRTYQDITLRIGLETLAGRAGTELTTVGNLVAVSQQTQRLRWADLASRAPVLDLADYRVTLARPGLSLSAGNLSTGNHRHLITGFASRGLGGSAKLGRLATLDASFLNGTNVIGWDNLLGFTVPQHRVGSANLALEMRPSQPGGFRLDLTGMDGSMLPLTDVAQGAVTDAEESRGWGGQLAWSDSKQRVQLTAGIARSRFVNPSDQLLAGDTALVATRATTKSARFGNLNLRLVNDLALSKRVRASLTASGRHERVDPLYRSLGAGTQADLESNGADLTASIGALSFQSSLGRQRDNLGRIPSILTTRTKTESHNLALPLGALFARGDRWHFPQLSFARQRTRQHGEGVPTNGDFSAGHVPDQVSTSQTGSLTWTVEGNQLAYRWSQSFQDNRQTGRERADFRAIVHSVALGLTPANTFTATLDVSVERQKSFETRVTQRLERVGGSVRWQPWRATELSGHLSQSWGLEPGVDQRSRNTEFQLEASQGFDLYRATDAGKQARIFFRFGRTRAARYLLSVPDLLAPDVQWNLSAGGSIRLY